MIDSREEEEKKDNVLQQINDFFEIIDWGGRRDKMAVKIIFRGRFNIKVFCVNEKQEFDND